MKKSTILLSIVTLTVFSTSCSKCYTCKAPVEITTSLGTVQEFQEEDFCTASPKELEAKELDGYTCTDT